MQTTLKNTNTIGELTKNLLNDHSVVIHGFGRFDLVIKKGNGFLPNCKGEYVTKRTVFQASRSWREKMKGLLK